MIRYRIAMLLVLLLTASLGGCGGKKIMVAVPPQIDLATLGTIGVISFDVQSDQQLPGDITLKFMQYLQAAQPGIPLLELGDQADFMREAGFTVLDAEAVKAIGRKYGIDTLLTGTLEVTHSLPDIRIGPDLTSVDAASYVQGNLNARLRQTRSGATVWSNGAHGKWKLAGLYLASGHMTSIDMNNVEAKYNKMLQELARVGTADFRSSYESREIIE